MSVPLALLTTASPTSLAPSSTASSSSVTSYTHVAIPPMSPTSTAVALMKPPRAVLPPSLYLSATTLLASMVMASAPLFCLSLALFGRALHVAVPKGVMRRTRRDGAFAFAMTGEGETHYRMYGDMNGAGPLVLLVHGYASSIRSFDPLATYLSTHFGARVIVPDLYGRGFSDVSDAPQTETLFVDQISELLQTVLVTPGRFTRGGDLTGLPPFHVIGWSMGGVIASSFALRWPDHVARLCLIAPAGLPTLKPASASLVRIPLLRNLMMWIGARVMFGNIRREWDSVTPPNDGSHAEKSKRTFIETVTYHPGYMRSLLRTLVEFRHLDGYESQYRTLGQHTRPLLLLWGDKDQTCPYYNALKLKDMMPSSRLHTLPHGTHAISLQRQRESHDVISAFLFESTATTATGPAGAINTAAVTVTATTTTVTATSS